MRIILMIGCLVILFTKGNAQDNTSKDDDDDDAKTEQKVVKKEEDEDEDFANNTIKVMIIPYNPSYYRRDVDKELGEAKYTDEKQQELKAWFSFGLDENISPRILTINHEKKQLLNDYSTDNDNDLSAIYSSLEYKYEKRDKKYVQKNQLLVDNLMGKLKQKDDFGVNGVNKDYESDKKHKNYVNVIIQDPTLLPRLSERYGVKLFIFINQFEIFTDYKKVIDEENKIYERQIKLHFSIFDSDGDQLYGDLSVLKFAPSVNKDIDQIIMERFPVVANFISANRGPAPHE